MSDSGTLVELCLSVIERSDPVGLFRSMLARYLTARLAARTITPELIMRRLHRMPFWFDVISTGLETILPHGARRDRNVSDGPLA